MLNFFRLHPTKHSHMSDRPKVHMLLHLVKDITISWYAAPTHFETEKGEQFNKFIREHAFYTNGRNNSRNVLRLFAYQLITRLVIKDDTWVARNGDRVSARTNPTNTYTNDRKFRRFFFDENCKNADNNIIIQPKTTISIIEVCISSYPFLIELHVDIFSR